MLFHLSLQSFKNVVHGKVKGGGGWLGQRKDFDAADGREEVPRNNQQRSVS